MTIKTETAIVTEAMNAGSSIVHAKKKKNTEEVDIFLHILETRYF